MQFASQPCSFLFLRVDQARSERCYFVLGDLPFCDVEQRTGVVVRGAVVGRSPHSLADKPTVFAIEAAEAVFIDELNAFSHAVVEVFRDALHVVRMQVSSPGTAKFLVLGATDKFGQRFVDEQASAVLGGGPQEGRSFILHLAKPSPALAV